MRVDHCRAVCQLQRPAVDERTHRKPPGMPPAVPSPLARGPDVLSISMVFLSINARAAVPLAIAAVPLDICLHWWCGLLRMGCEPRD